jgi:hypothetical protein
MLQNPLSTLMYSKLSRTACSQAIGHNEPQPRDKKNEGCNGSALHKREGPLFSGVLMRTEALLTTRKLM